MTDVGYGIRSKFKIDDSAFTQLERRIKSLDREWKTLMGSFKTGLAAAIDGPQVHRAFDNFERRMRRAASGGARGSGLVNYAAGIRLGAGESPGLQAARMRHAAVMAESRLPPVHSLAWHRQQQFVPQPYGPLGYGMLAAGAAAGGAALYGGYRAAGAIGGIQRQAETSREGIRGALVSVGGVSMGASADVSSRIYGNLERAAAAGPGETADYAEAFQRIFAPLHRAGASYKQIEGLVGQSIAGGSMLWGSRGAQLGPMDIMQALTSGMTRQHTPLAMMAAEATGVSKEKFNASNPMEQLNILMRGFAKFGPAIAVFANTVEAQEASFRDATKRWIRIATEPAFDAYRDNLKRMNVAMTDNADANTKNAESLRMVSKVAGDILAGGMGAAAGATSSFIEGMARGARETGDGWRNLSEDTKGLSAVFRDAASSLADSAGYAFTKIVGAMSEYNLNFVGTPGGGSRGNTQIQMLQKRRDPGYRNIPSVGMGDRRMVEDQMMAEMLASEISKTTKKDASPFASDEKDKTIHVKVEPLRIDPLDHRAFAISLTALLQSVAEQVARGSLSARNTIPAL